MTRKKKKRKKDILPKSPRCGFIYFYYFNQNYLFILAVRVLVVVCGIYIPDQGWNPGSLQ